MDYSPQAPLSMGLSWHEYWSGVPSSSPGHLPDPGMESTPPPPPSLAADSLPLSHQGRSVSIPWVTVTACLCELLLHSCLTLGDPMNCSLTGSSVHGLSRQEYWSGLPFPLPGDLPISGIEPASLCLLRQQAGSLPPHHWCFPSVLYLLLPSVLWKCMDILREFLLTTFSYSPPNFHDSHLCVCVC